MYDCYRKSLLFLRVFTRNFPIPLLRSVLSQGTLFPLGHHYCTSIGTSTNDSFRINYLVSNCGLSPDTASKVLISHRVTFHNSENPDAVVKLLRSLNLSDSNIRDIITKYPTILSATNIPLKLEFFRSKGASTSQLAQIMVMDPSVFARSLENRIIPNYDFIKSFLRSDERAMSSITRCTRIIADVYIQQKVKVFEDYGVPDSNIARVFRNWPRIFKLSVDDLKRELDEVKDLGFHPAKTPFIEAFTAKVYTKKSEKESFRINYLVNNCGFSPETASRLLSQKPVTFCNSENADSVLKHLRDLNLSDSKIRDIVTKYPMILSTTNILPKLEFLRSKGASTSQLAKIMVGEPTLLLRSLENRIIPNYDLIKSILGSDKRTITSMTRWTRIMSDKDIQQKVNLFEDYGLPDSSIARVFCNWPRRLNCSVDHLKRKLDEVKELGFHPSKSTFTEALCVRVMAKESTWKRKVKLYERWGWSDETLRKAFSRRPLCMVASDSKIEAMMEFFVNRLGWDSLVLAKYPVLFCYSLEKRIIPRGSVLLFLRSRGLIKNKPSSTPFIMSEEKFHQKFVISFKDEAPQLLKLYEEKFDHSR